MPTPTAITGPAPSPNVAPGSTADTPREAAEAFEKVLVRRFVKTMTKSMFDTGLSGKNGPNWMQNQRNQQRDVLTKVLADHIVEANTLGISEMLLRDWGITPASDSPNESSDTPVPTPSTPPSDLLEALPAGSPKIALRTPSTRR